MKKFVKIFSLECSFFYLTLWNDSDRLGRKDFINYKIKNNLFYYPGLGERGSVWYFKDELAAMEKKFLSVLRLNKAKLMRSVTQRLDYYWPLLFPYLTYKKKLKNIAEFERFYHNLVYWWSAMSLVFSAPDIKDLPDDVRQLILKYRAESQEYTSEMDKVMQNFFKKYYPEFKNIAWTITPAEAAAIAKRGISQQYYKKLLERRHGFGMFNEKMYSKSELKKVLLKKRFYFEDTRVNKVESVHGKATSKLSFVGKVCVIHTSKDFKKVKKGAVLITQMTTPDYIPSMRLAGAFVTDEGGLTCHAAIISRELKKPCIVGTRVATQVFKDGDMVEVDADRGIVRKI